MTMRKAFKWTFLALSALIVCFIGYYAYSFYSFARNIQKSPEDSPFKNVQTQPLSVKKGKEDLTPPKWEGKDRVNILLMGGDSRGLKENEIPRSDTIMVASIDPVTKKAHLFSILRDTYVKIPDYGQDRINAALAVGGPNLAMKTVSNLLGIPIQYYVYTDFKGFIALVDAVGGVEIDVEKNMKYSDSEDGHEYDINLKKGLQRLDGKTALQYVRFRHDALSDFARTERQRKFMQAIAKEMQSTSSILKLPRILQSIDPYIETNMTVSEMVKLGALGFEIRTDEVASQQIPPAELLEEKTVGGAEVIGVNPDKLKAFVNNLLNGEPDAKPAGKPTSASGAGGSKTAASSGNGSSQAAKTSGGSGTPTAISNDHMAKTSGD